MMTDQSGRILQWIPSRNPGTDAKPALRRGALVVANGLSLWILGIVIASYVGPLAASSPWPSLGALFTDASQYVVTVFVTLQVGVIPALFYAGTVLLAWGVGWDWLGRSLLGFEIASTGTSADANSGSSASAATSSDSETDRAMVVPLINVRPSVPDLALGAKLSDAMTRLSAAADTVRFPNLDAVERGPDADRDMPLSVAFGLGWAAAGLGLGYGVLGDLQTGALITGLIKFGTLLVVVGALVIGWRRLGLGSPEQQALVAAVGASIGIGFGVVFADALYAVQTALFGAYTDFAGLIVANIVLFGLLIGYGLSLTSDPDSGSDSGPESNVLDYGRRATGQPAGDGSVDADPDASTLSQNDAQSEGVSPEPAYTPDPAELVDSLDSTTVPDGASAAEAGAAAMSADSTQADSGFDDETDTPETGNPVEADAADVEEDNQTDAADTEGGVQADLKGEQDRLEDVESKVESIADSQARMETFEQRLRELRDED